MMEALSSSEMSVLTRATRRNIPEDIILHSHRRENLKSYNRLVILSGDEDEIILWSGVELSPLVLRPSIGLLFQPWMISADDDFGAIGGMNEWQGNRSTGRKPAPLPLW
jgi:hypothetical protein